jgi:hypothetical protein
MKKSILVALLVFSAACDANPTVDDDSDIFVRPSPLKKHQAYNQPTVPRKTVLGIAAFDDNIEPVYSKETGLPVNCRAYIQNAINGHRNGEYSAEAALIGIERNCGVNGWAWIDRRNR